MSSMVWVTGQYDGLLQTLINWYNLYDKGRPTSYRKIFNGTEECIGMKVTERAVQLEITDIQFNALLQLMETIFPGTEETVFLRKFKETTLSKSKLLRGKRMVTIALPREVVRGMLDLVYSFKQGTIDWSPRTGPEARKLVKEILVAGTTEKQGLFADEVEDEEAE